MAFTTKLFSFVFLVTLISFQIQVQARESQFFNKFTNNNYVKESEFPTKEESMKYKQVEQEPTFIPQTTQTGYGLYGHETTEPSPTTTTYNGVHYSATPTTTTYNGVHYSATPTTTTPTSFEPYTTTPTRTTPTSFEPYTTTPTRTTPTSVEPYTTTPTTTTTPTSFEPYTTTPTTTTLTSYEPYTNTPTTTTPKSFDAYNKNNYNNNVERQGMSDTRFVENGKYYYDINSERNYDRNNNQYGNTKVVDQKNFYNNRGGYFGNNNGGNFYDPNSNSFEGYQNQEQFQENDEVFDP